jgi:transcriptional regulator with XRE-family HTH domain
MKLVQRQTQLADLPECAELIGEGFPIENQSFKKDLIGMWADLIKTGRANSAVIEDRSANPFHIVGFGIAICITDVFIDELITNQVPYLAVPLVDLWKNHTLPVLSLAEVRKENRKEGLNILGLHTVWGLPGMSDEACSPIRDKMLSTLFANLRGYNMKRFIKETYGEEERSRHLIFGFRELNSYATVFPTTMGFSSSNHHPYLIGMSREEAMKPEMEGRLIRELFRHTQPVCLFTPKDQELLQLALTGMSEAHIAAVLNCAKEEIKARWESIYQHIPELQAEVLFSGHNYRQKSAALVAWLKNHPEELRPTSYFEGIDLLGDLPNTPPPLPKMHSDESAKSVPVNKESGGFLLRALRKERSLSLEDLANEADITPLALSNMELKYATPQRARLITILNVLSAAKPLTIQQRRDVLESFGYTDIITPPNDADIAIARAVWNESFKDALYPAYMVDIKQDIHDWNSLALGLMALSPDQAKNISLFDLLFSPSARGTIQLVNAEEVVTTTVAHIWSDISPYKDQDWCKEVIENARKKYPIFAHILDSLADSPSVKNMNAIESVILKDAEGTTLSFRLVGLDMLHDSRFRVVQYIPSDAPTMHFLSKFTGNTLEKVS